MLIYDFFYIMCHGSLKLLKVYHIETSGSGGDILNYKERALMMKNSSFPPPGKITRHDFNVLINDDKIIFVEAQSKFQIRRHTRKITRKFSTS